MADADRETMDRSLERLLEGNRRCLECGPHHPRQDAGRRAEVAAGQHPFAVIVGCSDSRIPPEVVFDKGLGDLFVVRLAGNVVDDMALGSVEYAVEHLGTRLVVVLGHARCGAVTAAVNHGDAPGHVHSIVKAILPAIEKARGMPGDLVDNAIRVNVAMVADRIRACEPILAPMARGGEIRVVEAYYDVTTGKVDILR